MNGLPVAWPEPVLEPAVEPEVEPAVVADPPAAAVVLVLELELLLPQAATAVNAKAAVPEASR